MIKKIVVTWEEAHNYESGRKKLFEKLKDARAYSKDFEGYEVVRLYKSGYPTNTYLGYAVIQSISF